MDNEYMQAQEEPGEREERERRRREREEWERGIGRTGTATSTAYDDSTTGADTGLTAPAREYGQRIADAASIAREYVSDRAGVVGEKIQDLRNKDYAQIADEAKEYARQKPGQALLISAAAGFIIGLLIRGSRR